MGLWKDKTRKHWCYSFQYQGRNYAARGFQDRRIAEAARVERRKEVRTIQQETDMVYSDVVNLYLDHAERSLAVKTYKYKVYVYKCFYIFLKNDFPVQDITTQIVDSYLKTRPSNNNYNVHKKDLSALFTYAKNILEVIYKNPVIKIKNLPHTKKTKQIPKEKDIIKLILAANPKTDEKNLLIVLLHTLARIDEVLRLTWADINFEKKILTKWTRKTKDGSYKSVPVKINQELFKTLWGMWESKEQDKWVFYNSRTENRYKHRPKFMKGLCERAGVEPFGFHALRHLMASLLSDNPKITTKTIQKILGHSEARTTEIYLHELDSSQKNAMDFISGKFTQKKQKPQPKSTTKKNKKC